MLKIRNASLEDLPQLLNIENLCFSKEDAATKPAFEKRLRFISDTFFVAEENGLIKGLINGPVIEEAFITDDLFSEIKENPATGGHQSILGLAVAPDYRNHGIASALLTHLEKEARANKRVTVTLTCKERLIPFYEKNGYQNAGISESQHGGSVWYNMIKRLR